MVTYNKHFHPILICTQGHISPHGKNYYKLLSTYKPSPMDIRQAQIWLGYDPQGYDGPFNVEIKQDGKKWVTYWESSSSSE
jgi:hypothetical protein